MELFVRRYLPYYRNNLRVALPVMLSQAGQVTVNLADNIMVGHYSAIELAASAFAHSVAFLGMYFIIGFALGSTPLIGVAFARGNDSEVNSLFVNSLRVNILVALVVFALMMASSFFLGSMGQPASVVDIAARYYRITAWSLLPLTVFLAYKQAAEGVGDTRTAMFVTVGSNVLNIILNWVFIFGRLGFPAMGLAGAGYATLISRMAQASAMAVVFSARPGFRRFFALPGAARAARADAGRLFRTGLPLALQMTAEMLLFTMAAVMVGWIGDTSLAAHQVTLSVTTVTYMISVGLGSGTTIRVSHHLGAGRYADMRRAGYASLHLVLAFMGLCGVLIYVFRWRLPFLFLGQGGDAEVAALASALLVITALYQLADGAQVALSGALRGLADVQWLFRTSLFCYAVVGLPSMYLLGFVAGLDARGIWLGLALALFASASAFLVRFRRVSARQG